MSIRCCRLTLLSLSAIISITSICYFFSIISLEKCKTTFFPYDALFVTLLGVMFSIITLYYFKLLLCGDCCCSCIVVLAIILCIGGMATIIIFNLGILNSYGIGFDNICQLVTTLYIIACSLSILIVLIVSITYKCSCITCKDDDEEKMKLLNIQNK